MSLDPHRSKPHDSMQLSTLSCGETTLAATLARERNYRGPTDDPSIGRRVESLQEVGNPT